MLVYGDGFAQLPQFLELEVQRRRRVYEKLHTFLHYRLEPLRFGSQVVFPGSELQNLECSVYVGNYRADNSCRGIRNADGDPGQHTPLRITDRSAQRCRRLRPGADTKSEKTERCHKQGECVAAPVSGILICTH